MRVLFDRGDIHGLVPAGRFTIKANGRVEWHTPYSALVTHAGALDDEPFLPGVDLGDAVDALRLGESVALAHDDRIEVGGRTIAIAAEYPRLPGLSPMEDWRGSEFHGAGPRTIRLSPSADGFFVTSNASGHVLYAGERITGWRVPAGTENTIFAAQAGANTLVGIRWNGRHSDLLLVQGDRLVSRWPADDDEESVRWGMPAPAVMGDYVVTYSDEGPFRKQLALLRLPTLDEIDHVPMPEWPADLATDGKRFAAISYGYLVIGHVENGTLAIDEELTIREIMKRAGIGPAPRSSSATNDRRGTRTWLDGSLARLCVDGAEVIVAGPRGGIHRLGGNSELIPMYEPFAKPSAGASVMDRFFARSRTLFDARHDRLVIGRGGELVLVERESLTDLIAVPAQGAGVGGWVFGDGLLYVVEEPKSDFGEEFVIRYVERGDGAHTEPRILGRCPRGGANRQLPLCHLGDSAIWFEGTHLARFDGREVTRTETPFIKSVTAFGDRVFTLRDDHVYEGDRRITTAPLPFAVRTLVATADAIYFVEPLTTQRDGINPSQLWRIDLATGAQRVVSTATIGAISSLTLVNHRLHWLEARDSSMSFFKLGENEDVSAVCTLPLDG